MIFFHLYIFSTASGTPKLPKQLLSCPHRPGPDQILETSSVPGCSNKLLRKANHIGQEGVAFGAVALLATWMGLIKSSERHEVIQRSVHSKQQKKEADDSEWHHTLRLFFKASQMVGSTSVAVAYMAILWVRGESESQTNYGAQEVQDACWLWNRSKIRIYFSLPKTR